MAVGDGAIVRAGLEALLDGLHKIAAPTGARGSVLLMTGGLIVLGFLFLAFLFRSAIVGDLAPVANGRAPARRVDLPPRGAVAGFIAAPPARAFEGGRERGMKVDASMDRALDALAQQGFDARITRTRAGWKMLRAYRCASCAAGSAAAGCEYERGLLAGAFETIAGDLAKVHEVRCKARGDEYCEFEVRHAPLLEAR